VASASATAADQLGDRTMWRLLAELLGLSSYGFNARIRPVLLSALPIALTIWVWAGEVSVEWGWLAGLAVAAGLPFLLGERAADLGRARQAELWRSWGGAPTLQLVRHRTATLNPQSLSRIHAALSLLCGAELPSPQQEAARPDAADTTYSSCLHAAVVTARDNPAAFPVVHQANVNYGYRRNLWAIRWWAVSASLVSIAGIAAHVGLFGLTTAAAIALLVSVGVAGAVWAADSESVREPATVYAHRLLESIERMARDHPLERPVSEGD
jgi:hypothetical protein